MIIIKSGERFRCLVMAKERKRASELSFFMRNAAGGRRDVIFGAFANGILIFFLPALLLPVLGSLGFEGITFGDSDFGIVGILVA